MKVKMYVIVSLKPCYKSKSRKSRELRHVRDDSLKYSHVTSRIYTSASSITVNYNVAYVVRKKGIFTS